MGKKATFILIDKIFTVLSFINAFFIVIFSNNLFISYRDNEISGYLGFIIPFMILLNIIFIIVWLFKKKWIVSIILFICLFCSYNFINVRYQFRKAPPKSVLKEKSNPNNLRLITYNIADFVAKDEQSLETLARVMELDNVDIGCFQEFKLYTQPQDSVRKHFSKYPYFYNNLSDTSQNINIAIFSKYPLSYVIHHHFPYSSFDYLTARVNTPQGELTIITPHFQTTGLTTATRDYYEKKKHGYKMSAFEFLEEFTDSFEYNNELRKMQINVICDSIAKIDTPIILCGDFNDIPLSYLYNKTSRILKDSFLESGFGYMYTYKHLKKLLRIDYVFHSNELRSVKYYSPNLPFSDHNPVVCELEFIN